MLLKELLCDLDYEVVRGTDDIEIKNLVYDSRKVEKGSVFVCISGAVRDAHEFAGEVCENGAAALIIEKDIDIDADVTTIKVANTREALAVMSAAYFGFPANELTTIGITGTKGKTTSTYMVRSILEASGIKTGLIGTIETIIGDENIPSQNTTPESYVVQEYFRKMVDAGCECVVMEVSSQGLMLNRVSGFVFDYGIFTNLEKDHIGPNEHKDMDDYIYCKSILFRQCRHGIFNVDDKYLDRILKGHTCRVETYGFSENADYRATEPELYEHEGKLGVAYKLSGKMEMDVKIDIPGKFSIYNSLAAIAICEHFGVSISDIKENLENIKVRGRVESVNISSKFSIMIDYAHNAMSLESLLSTLREYKPKRLVCIFGCGGNRSKDRRFEMGEISSKLADLTIITSDNPRNEEPADIIADIVTGVKRSGGDYVTIEDRAEAVKYAILNAKEGDVIVLAGKGHEDYQEIKGKKYHMDEKELIYDVVNNHDYLGKYRDK